jgi:hypothetical protein
MIEGIADDVRQLLRQNVVIDIVSWIGIEDKYAYDSNRIFEGNRMDAFFRTVNAWVKQHDFPRAPAPGMG